MDCATSGAYVANFNTWLQELSSDLGTFSYVKTQAEAGAAQVGTNMTYDDLLGKGAVRR